jgi:hypothetical protein
MRILDNITAVIALIFLLLYCATIAIGCWDMQAGADAYNIALEGLDRIRKRVHQ